MRIRLCRVLLLAIVLTCAGSSWALELPETGIRYEIEVTLDPETRRLEGRETILWTNPSSTVTLEALRLHLYLNGFSHEGTTWARSAPSSRLDFDEMLEVHDNPWGYSEPRSIQQGGVELDWRPIAPDDGNPQDRSLIEVTLAQPLLPGESVLIDVEFDARLPVPMARTGGRDDFFFVAQWFPKVAMFELAGTRGATRDDWNSHQFFGPTEFYAEFADFDVQIGVPHDWTVVATGKGGPDPEKTRGDLQWHHYTKRAVPDFAWSTGSGMIDVVSNHDPAGPGGPVELHLFVEAGMEHQAIRLRNAAEASLDVMGSRIGPYPHDTLTVVASPFHAAAVGGMEYPTLITGVFGDPMWDGALLSELRIVEAVVAHEFAHQYFPFLIGSNEFEEAYMDEGFTQYWGNEIMISMFGDQGGFGQLLGRSMDITALETSGLSKSGPYPRPVWSRPSFIASHSKAFSQFYTIPAVTMATAARLFGQGTVDRVFSAYFDLWAFRHPRFEDYLAVARETGGDKFADFVRESYTQERLPDYRVQSLKTEEWKRPRGRLVTPEGVIEPDAEESEELELAGLDEAARDPGQIITVEVLDPGWNHQGELGTGSIERLGLVPEMGEAEEDWEVEEKTFYTSKVRVEGPGWDHLPVEVQFRFADGKVVRDDWDGRAGYRIYTFLRSAPVSEVRIDPELEIALDPKPWNNGLLREDQGELSKDWSKWMGSLAQFLLEGMNLCL